MLSLLLTDKLKVRTISEKDEKQSYLEASTSCVFSRSNWPYLPSQKMLLVILPFVGGSIYFHDTKSSIFSPFPSIFCLVSIERRLRALSVWAYVVHNRTPPCATSTLITAKPPSFPSQSLLILITLVLSYTYSKRSEWYLKIKQLHPQPYTTLRSWIMLP